MYTLLCVGVGVVIAVVWVYVWGLCRAAATRITIDDGNAFGGDGIE